MNTDTLSAHVNKDPVLRSSQNQRTNRVKIKAVLYSKMYHLVINTRQVWAKCLRLKSKGTAAVGAQQAE